MLADLHTQITAALVALEAHKAALTDALAKVEAELARVPTLDDVKTLLARVT